MINVFSWKLFALSINKSPRSRWMSNSIWPPMMQSIHCHQLNCTCDRIKWFGAPVLFIFMTCHTFGPIRYDSRNKRIFRGKCINISFHFAICLPFFSLNIDSGCLLRFWRWLLFVIVTMRVEITVKRKTLAAARILYNKTSQKKWLDEYRQVDTSTRQKNRSKQQEKKEEISKRSK